MNLKCKFVVDDLIKIHFVSMGFVPLRGLKFWKTPLEITSECGSANPLHTLCITLLSRAGTSSVVEFL